MELFNNRRVNKETKDEHVGEPVRGSSIVLVIKVLLVLILFDGIYSFIYYILSLGVNLPFDFHHHTAILLLIVQLGKITLQFVLLLHVVLSWANNLYFLTDEHIIKRGGVLKVQEEIFHYKNIRSISIHQSWIGKLCNYGDILLKTSASGGYQDDIVLSGIANPQRYKEVLKRYF